jgi:hypothetical protein
MRFPEDFVCQLIEIEEEPQIEPIWETADQPLSPSLCHFGPTYLMRDLSLLHRFMVVSLTSQIGAFRWSLLAFVFKLQRPFDEYPSLP